MPTARFKLVVGVMSALTVAVYVAEPFLVGSAAAERQAAPEFTLTTVDGSVFRLADQQSGTVVLVDFMATWCFPCRQQLMDLRELRAEFPAAALTIVSVDEEYGLDPARVQQFRQEFGAVSASMEGARWFFAVDTVEEHVGLKYSATALPTVVLVDGDGKIARSWFGGVSSAVLEGAIAAELSA